MNINRGTPPPRQGGGGGQGRRDRYQSAPSPELPPEYLKNGYFDEKGNVIDQVIVVWPQKIAKALGNSGVTYLQIRRFFTQVRSVERELGSKDFDELVVRIQSLKPLVASFVGRGSNRYERQGRENLKRFIDCNVELATRNEHSFKRGFVPHFECVIAYFKYYFPSK